MNDILNDSIRNKSLIIDKNTETVASNHLFVDNLDAVELNTVQTYNNNNKILNLPNHIPDLLNVNTNLYEELVSKSNQYESLFKEIDKLAIDNMYEDGDMQYIQTKMESDKKELNELERLLQEAAITLEQLVHEKELVHDNLKDKHKAFKKAAKYFKIYPNFYIFVDVQEDTMKVTVCYFTQKFNDTYSCTISKNNKDKWKLNSIKPPLTKSAFLALQDKFEISNNMVALLCTIRKIFLLYKNKN